MSEDVREKILQAMMGQEEAKLWAPYLNVLGLSDEEIIKRLVRIMVVHFLLDRLLTVVLSNKLLGPPPGKFSDIHEIVAELEMKTRIDLAQASQLISDSTAGKVRTVNTIRNKLAHYQPKKGWGFAHIPELSSPKAFDKCTHNAMDAIHDLMSKLNDLVGAYPSTVP